MGVFGTDIRREAVCVFEPGATKHEALDAMVDAIVETGVVTDREAFQKAVYEREAVMSTGIGQGVAIPHVRLPVIKEPTVGVGVSQEGVDFDTLDNEPVNIIVLFAMPAGSQKEYLGLLAQVMVALKVPGFRERLLACQNCQDVLTTLNEL
jgi:nitrogen PTS system EIIA component